MKCDINYIRNNFCLILFINYFIIDFKLKHLNSLLGEEYSSANDYYMIDVASIVAISRLIE